MKKIQSVSILWSSQTFIDALVTLLWKQVSEEHNQGSEF